MFLIGLFSQTQIHIVGSIAISELVFFLIAPFVFVAHQDIFRRERIVLPLRLIVMAMIGCIVATIVNHTDLISTLKGFSTIYGLWAGIVIFYVLLRKSPMSFRWYLLGGAFSFVLCTFFFQGDYELVQAEFMGYSEKGAAAGIASGPLYWVGRLSGFVMWPIQGFYLKCPLAYSVLGTFIFGAWSLLTTASGRSSALIAVFSAALIAVGGKSVRRMRRIRSAFWMLVLAGILFLFAFKAVYSYTASHGMLGEAAQQKYERQTRGKSSMLSLVKGGRGEVFVGLYACCRNPIWGYGSWARDHYGIVSDYMARYADPDEVAAYFEWINRPGRTQERIRLIPGHSAIVQWWLWYGILGLPFWLYLLYRIYRCIRYDIAHVPEFFGYLAIALPGQLWGACFSPFGARLPWAFFVTMILLVRTMKVDDVMRMRRVR